jgi:hypothetical protein
MIKDKRSLIGILGFIAGVVIGLCISLGLMFIISMFLYVPEFPAYHIEKCVVENLEVDCNATGITDPSNPGTPLSIKMFEEACMKNKAYVIMNGSVEVNCADGLTADWHDENGTLFMRGYK